MLVFVLLSSACLIERGEFEEQRRLIQDADADGITILDGDCDDQQPSVSPIADEVCDGIDNDCDQLVDDDDDSLVSAAVYQDGDGDGYGGVELEPGCESEAIGTPVGGDCDDADPAINPDAEEICSNGVDENCDGSSEGCLIEGVVSIQDYADWTFDVDDDSYIRSVYQNFGVDTNSDQIHDVLFQEHDENEGIYYVTAVEEGAASDDEPIFRVEQPSSTPQLSYIPFAERANFLDMPALFLTSEEEILMFEMPLSGELEYADRDAAIYWDDLGVGNPFRFNSIGDVTNDGITDMVLSYGGVSSDLAGYMFSSNIREYENLSDAVPIYSDETVSSVAGIVSAGDLNADGIEDAVFSFPVSSTYTTNGGEVGVFYGPLSQTALSLADADAVVYGSQPQEGLGVFGLTCVGDTSGDGFDEFLLGSPLYNDGDLSGAGRAIVIDHSTIGVGGSISVDDAGTMTILGDTSLGRTGLVTDTRCGGDFDGDGANDIAVVSVQTAATEQAQGTVALFYGPMSGQVYISDADTMFTSPGQLLQGAGIYSPASPGDVGTLFTFGAAEDESFIHFVMTVPGQGL